MREKEMKNREKYINKTISKCTTILPLPLLYVGIIINSENP